MVQTRGRQFNFEDNLYKDLLPFDTIGWQRQALTLFRLCQPLHVLRSDSRPSIESASFSALRLA